MTRSGCGEDAGDAEGSVIVMRILRSGLQSRRAILSLAGIILVGLALWIRHPVALGSAAAPSSASRSQTLDGVRSAIAAEAARLAGIATRALAAPPAQAAASAYLASLTSGVRGESVVLYDSSGALAWAGHVRSDPDTLSAPIGVSFGEFFVTLSAVRTVPGRRAVASSVLQAAPPADQLSGSLAAASAPRWNGVRLVSGFAVSPAGSGIAVLNIAGSPAIVATVSEPPAAEMRLEQSLAMRERAAALLFLGFVILFLVGWRSRHDLVSRLYAVGIGLLLAGIFPWSQYSNSSRLFDPGFYFSNVGGPFTANAAALLATAALILLAAFALVRAHTSPAPSRVASMAGAVILLALGVIIASNLVRGVGQPTWGSTPGLWLSWEIPLFLFIFSVLIAVGALLHVALGGPLPAATRGIVWIALVAAIAASSEVWVTTTHERMRLAERDVAGLARADDNEEVLLRRFISSLAPSVSPRDGAGLLRLYAASELADADFPVLLTSVSADGTPVARLDLAAGGVDSGVVYRAASSMAAGEVTAVLGPTGVQLVGLARHPDGGMTLVAALPHTRLVAAPPFASLLGLGEQSGGDPPYAVTLAQMNPAVVAGSDSVRWLRIGDVWHGDRLIPTSVGMRRAHVEVDLRSFSARSERAFLIVLLDLLVAGLLWLGGAGAERPFPRWLRVRAVRWVRTYRGRLTIALFGFFVIPALAFAVWSYQRLRSDDRRTRELLVSETLQTIASANETDDLAAAGKRFDTPLFRYSGGFLNSVSDPLYAVLPPGGLTLPSAVQTQLEQRGEPTAAWEQRLGPNLALFGYRSVLGRNEERYVLAAPARGDDLTLDRRRRDLGILLLFLTALGGLSALWLSGIAAKRLARDLELSRIEVARAERVIAWGEMARQVAHEIKNPLTPIRLGVQHLRRARHDARPDFDKVLEDNVGRILSEIDRLDAIARSFSRYGSAPADLPPAERVDAAAVVRDVIALEQMGQGDVKWKLRGADQSLIAMARAEELREVLLNVLENARQAGARRIDVEVTQEDRRITVEVLDDGPGIPPDILPRVFEPHFSTRTTGSGLGLAASRRIIEHWRGEIAIANRDGRGARVLIALVRASV